MELLAFCPECTDKHDSVRRTLNALDAPAAIAETTVDHGLIFWIPKGFISTREAAWIRWHDSIDHVKTRR